MLPFLSKLSTLYLTGLPIHDILSVTINSYRGILHFMNLIQRLTEIQELPTLPEIALRIRALIVSEEGNATMLARLIEHDPSLSAKVLKVANSAFYCTPNRKITSVKLAITRIGFNQIGHIAMAVCLIRQFSRKSDILDYRQFWKHCLSAAFLTNLIPDTGNSTEQNHSLFLSGLFHDIGILVFDQFFHKQFEQIINYAIEKEISYLEAEKELFPNETHAAIGSALMEMWKIDLSVVNSVRYHHAPEKAPVNLQAAIWATYLSEYILCNSGLGSFEGMIQNGNKDVIGALNLTSDMICSYLKLAEYEVDRSELILALDSNYSPMQLRAV